MHRGYMKRRSVGIYAHICVYVHICVWGSGFTLYLRVEDTNLRRHGN